VTYKDLVKYARFLAIKLCDQGVVPGIRVPIVAKRALEMVVGVVAVLMCGAQYVPLDDGVVPENTLRHVIGEVGGNVVLCLRDIKGRIDDLGINKSVIVLEDILRSVDESKSIDTAEDMCLGDENSGCYVVYTSGASPYVDNLMDFFAD
jgi:non-ribosomal peptide synthetase component F